MRGRACDSRNPLPSLDELLDFGKDVLKRSATEVGIVSFVPDVLACLVELPKKRGQILLEHTSLVDLRCRARLIWWSCLISMPYT